ncbi:MAG: hypothetical protein DMG07_12315 [Acidobacteria bacterium]|nr:MAG: hypothetical protein DMG07_12315 [Acidobacteriota bacterium]
MRKEKALIALLRGIVDLLAEESDRNPEFAARLEGRLSGLPEHKASGKTRATPKPPERLPDLHAEWTARGETDFRIWLRDQTIPVLRALIRAQDIDPTRRTVKWREAEKLADFLADGLRARMSRGSAFLGRGTPEPDTQA